MIIQHQNIDGKKFNLLKLTLNIIGLLGCCIEIKHNFSQSQYNVTL